MATDNNIKNFTGADIEKYHKGLLSAKERHDLEKAALEDPFLADALEGYAVAGVDHAADMDELKKRLADKLETGKVIAMKGGGKTSFPWLRVAAMLIIVAGAGLLAQQLFFTNPSKDIAQLETKKSKEIKSSDSSGNTATSATTEIKNQSETAQPENKGTTTITKETLGDVSTKDKVSTLTKTDKVTAKTEPVTVNSNAYLNINPPAGAGAEEKQKVAEEKVSPVKDERREETKAIAKNDKINVPDKEGDGVKDKFDAEPSKAQKKNNAVVARNSRKEDEQKVNPGFGLYNQSNTFRGRVTDSNNVGLPFARVYNPTDNNAGTYTDVTGNFNLTYPDSVLNVQVRSVGFENASVQLRNNVANNRVILQDDRSLAAQTMPAPRKVNAEERSKIVKLEEPEPADGWENYDTYIVNNLNPPEEIKTRQNTGAEVEVSFEVDKNGNPVNIKVEKSLCKKCDDEAIRLIKEGPKWKRNAKKGRTTVTVPFNNSL